MDDILFRHKATATPHDKCEAFIKRQNESEQAKALVNEAKLFDAKLGEALNIDVPSDLLDKILLEQSFVVESERAVSGRWHIAIAASIAFVLGISIPLFSNYIAAPSAIGQVAMQHVLEEYYFTEKVDERADNRMINAKLASYGGQLQGSIGHVSYVNYCGFAGVPSLHMVMRGEKGNVTVFVVPSDAKVDFEAQFSNQHLHGITEQIEGGYMVIVGERGEPLQSTQEKLRQNIQWEI